MSNDRRFGDMIPGHIHKNLLQRHGDPLCELFPCFQCPGRRIFQRFLQPRAVGGVILEVLHVFPLEVAQRKLHEVLNKRRGKGYRQFVRSG